MYTSSCSLKNSFAEVRITKDRASVSIGYPVVLMCEVSGDPRNIIYSWIHEGMQLPTETSTTLTIPSFDTDDDAGTYSCEAMNVEGIGRGDITIVGEGEVLYACRLIVLYNDATS